MIRGGGGGKNRNNEGKKKYVAEENEKAKKEINTKWYITKRENEKRDINMEGRQYRHGHAHKLTNTVECGRESNTGNSSVD